MHNPRSGYHIHNGVISFVNKELTREEHALQ
jgi:hypothetical protein